VAALIVELARAAREEAAQMRVASLELRLAVHESNRLAHARTARAAAATNDSIRRRRAMTAASPWSGLDWFREDEQLSRVLVPLD